MLLGEATGMSTSTTLDKVIGVILMLLGCCGIVGMGMTYLGLNVSEEQTSQMTADQKKGLAELHKMVDEMPWYLPFATASSACMEVAGIGVFLGRRWGFMLTALLVALSLIVGIMMFSRQSDQGPAQLATTVVSLAINFALGAYCVWRLMAVPPPPVAPPMAPPPDTSAPSE